MYISKILYGGLFLRQKLCMNWLLNFSKGGIMVAIIGIISRRGVRIEVHHRN